MSWYGSENNNTTTTPHLALVSDGVIPIEFRKPAPIPRSMLANTLRLFLQEQEITVGDFVRFYTDAYGERPTTTTPLRITPRAQGTRKRLLLSTQDVVPHIAYRMLEI